MSERRIFLSPPFVGEEEREAVMQAFDSGYVAPCGPMVDEFERRIAKCAGRKHAVAVASGTAALDLLMDEFAVDQSWTVFAPTLTFIATVGPAFRRGAKLVFIDADATGNMDVGLLGKALAARTTRGNAMVISVDLYGRCCDYAAIEALCRREGAVFVSDSAEAVGAVSGDGRPAGAAGAAAVYSFNGNKIITTSGGGAILTDDDGIAERARKRSQQSREACVWYEHREVGHNYRMSNLLAAVGISQLEKLPFILEKRRMIREFYQSIMTSGCELWPCDISGGKGNNWLTVVSMPSEAERDAAIARLAEANVESRPVWKPMHLQPVFAGCEVFGGETSERLFERGLCLPSGTGMTVGSLIRVSEALNKLFDTP